MRYYRSKSGDVLDRIVWENYGTQSDGIVERVLQANPGLADQGPVLPAGLRIALPEAETVQAAAQTGSVRLWG